MSDFDLHAKASYISNSHLVNAIKFNLKHLDECSSMPGFRQKLLEHGNSTSGSSSSKGSTNEHASLFTPLGGLLVNLWTEGEISAIAVQKIAHCAFLNTGQQSDLVGLAALGSFGVHAGNVKRDLQRL